MTVDTNQHPPITDPSHQLPEHGADSRRRKIWWSSALIVLLLVVLLAALLLWRHHEAATKKKPAPPKIPVTTATAKKGDIGVYLDEIGTVTPVYTASITSEVGGQVVAVHFREGQIVRKGDPLIEIDARPYRATLLQAQGALERDENVLAQAKMDLQRYQDAWARRAIAKQQMDDQEKIVLQDEGTVKNDQGTVQYDQVQVDFCHIVAPISGRVGLRLVDPGNVVQASGTVTLAVITQLEPITVIFTIPEDSLGPVAARLKKNAKLNADAFDRTAQKKIASGTLLTLDNQIDTTTGTVKARSVFANKDDALFPNQFVNVRLLVNTLQGVTLVPAAAIQQNGQSSFVYVIQNNVAHNRGVKVGVTDAGMTQVEGIDAGDVVATSSFDKLQENTAVSISNKDSTKGSNSTSSAQANTSGSSAP
ncbi:MAG TPA: efflux RND transporter periplasmic adaptor subunit [Terriglobales bacterium]|nr:efflux RND transporter periplasmic adaptor subunit [Terriglobales bacterium]